MSKTSVKKTSVSKGANSVQNLEAMTKNQGVMMSSFRQDTLIVGDGSAGTGKTLLACWWAAKQLVEHKKKVILIRAYQPLAKRTIGFLPGTAEEKLAGYYKQLIDYMVEFLGKGVYDCAIKNGNISLVSLEEIRGRSWDDATVIIDESQNLFVEEVQALTTRVGNNTQMIMIGDASGLQSDVKGLNGLVYLEKLVEKYGIEDVGFVKFTKDDVVRSGFVKNIVFALEDEFYADREGRGIVSTMKG